MINVRPLDSSFIGHYLQHLARNIAESGQVGTPIFLPYSSRTPWDAEGRRQGILDRWTKPINVHSWERAWGAFDGEKIIGHIDLGARKLETSLHRASIGMGIENGYRGAGLGTQLLDRALTWAREQPSISWIDLNVFAHNSPAITLYRKFDFVEVGRINDFFRVDGQSADDIHMVLKV